MIEGAETLTHGAELNFSNGSNGATQSNTISIGKQCGMVNDNVTCTAYGKTETGIICCEAKTDPAKYRGATIREGKICTMYR